MDHDAESADALMRENAELRADRALLRAYLSEARSELNEARSAAAALVEACLAVAYFVESYAPDSHLARAHPMIYGMLRVYGRNARSAVAAAIPHARALLAELSAARIVAAAVRQSSAMDEPRVKAAIAAYDAQLRAAKE